MVLESVTSGRPVFPASLVKEIVFSPLHILASFVKDKVSIGAWIYLWDEGGLGSALGQGTRSRVTQLRV